MKYQWMLMVCAVWSLAATDAAWGQKKSPQRKNPVLEAAFGETWLKANLTVVQEQKLTQLVQSFAPKMFQAEKAIVNVYTKEQQEVLRRARELAVRAQVKPANIDKRVKEAEDTLTLTDDQKKQLAEARKAKQTLSSEFQQAAIPFLEADQVNTLFLGGKKKKN